MSLFEIIATGILVLIFILVALQYLKRPSVDVTNTDAPRLLEEKNKLDKEVKEQAIKVGQLEAQLEAALAEKGIIERNLGHSFSEKLAQALEKQKLELAAEKMTSLQEKEAIIADLQGKLNLAEKLREGLMTEHQMVLQSQVQHHKLELKNAEDQKLAEISKYEDRLKTLLSAHDVEKANSAAQAQKQTQLAVAEAQAVLNKRLKELEGDVNVEREANKRLNKDLYDAKLRYEEDLKKQDELRQEIQKQLLELKEQVKETFANATHEAMKTNGEAFAETAKLKLEDLLKPVNLLKEKVDEQIKEGISNKSAFEEQIKNLQAATEKIQLDANNLTEALRGNKKVLGDWGELQLKNLLDNAGLKEGDNYETQSHIKGEEGNKQIPDVIIYLPDGKRIVVDSKVSLVSYQDYVNAESEEKKTASLNGLVQAVENHVKTLSSKTYQNQVKDAAPYVLMFMPLEPAFIAATTHKPSLWSNAHKSNVVIVTPSTLMAVLLTVEQVWQQKKRKDNAEEIAKAAGKVYDKLVGFVAGFEKLGEQLEKASQSYETAKGQLMHGKGNAIKQLEGMRRMGLTTSKTLSAGILDSAGVDVESEEDGE